MARSHHHGKKWSLYLTHKDIDKNENVQQGPFLPGGTYESPSHFASVQFYLLREKVFDSFQKSIQEYRTKNIECNTLCGIIYLQNGHVYTYGTLHKKNLKFLGEIYTVRMKSESFHNFSRYLQPGDIICMSADKFKTFIFVQVISCESPPYHKLSCGLEIMVDNNTCFDSKLNVGSVYHILVTGTCHESHIQSLRKLKLFSKVDFPLRNALLNVESCDKLPPWLPDQETLDATREHSRRRFNEEPTLFSSLETIGKKQFHLDEQQATAFKTALTNQVAVIEGCPGSGKTFLCTALMRFLLSEASIRLKSPTLFLCKTESCLDNQLECMLSHTENIIRVGGPSKRDTLKHCWLSNRRRNVNPEQMAERETAVEEGDREASRTGSVNSAKGTAVRDKANFPRSRSYMTHPQKQLLLSPATVQNTRKRSRVRMLSKSLDSLEANSSTINESIEYFTDDTDEINDIDVDSYFSETRNDITKLKSAAKNISLFPLKDVDTVEQIVPQKLHRKFTAMIKSSKPAGSVEDTANDEKLQLKNVVIRWLCLTPQDMDSIKENSEFLRNVLVSYQKKRGFLSEAIVDEHHMNLQELRKYNELLGKIFSPDADTFPIIEETALVYSSKINPTEISPPFSSSGTAACHSSSSINLWHLSFFQRYQEFSKWRQLALYNVNKQRTYLERAFKNRVEMIKKEIMMRSVSCSVKSDIVGMTFRCAVQHPEFLKRIAPKVVIADESDEVLEGEIITCLPTTVQHLILIGSTGSQIICGGEDQGCLMTLPKRLKQYGAPSWSLRTQHRMRSTISELLFRVNNENMEYYPDIKNLSDIESVSNNVFFVEHKEDMDAVDKGHVTSCSLHEAKFLLCLFNYLSKTNHSEININLLVSSTEQMDLVNELSKKNGLDANALQISEFKGEETDIVLLSLANKVNCDPMRIFEGLYTAMTRARIGFFCIGNFDLYTRQCSSLNSFMFNVRSKGLSGEALLLRCTNHPDSLTAVSSPKDFKKLRLSGCSKTCKK